MESEELNQEMIENSNAEELTDEQMENVAGGTELPEPGTEGSCPKLPNGGDHDWYLVQSWPDGRDGRWTGENWRCRRCGKVYNRFV
ncbi:MAG: hypothetical protein J6D34_09245 [Atopobiaceae bacterium]|nr:hypothetical protein [Atopobiaceae bacterium]